MIPIIITSPTGKLDDRVREVLKALDQPVIHHVKEREAWDPIPERNRVINIARGRTEALRQAMKAHRKAEHFLFLDADIVPPLDIFDRFNEVADDNRILGAWWKSRFGGTYVGGYWRDGVVSLFSTILCGHRVQETHLVSLGCTLVPRRFVVEHEFDPGIDSFVRNRAGQLFQIADSGAFSRHVTKQGGRMYLDSRVVAKHLSEGEEIEY
jgi:hypothetical protein